MYRQHNADEITKVITARTLKYAFCVFPVATVVWVSTHISDTPNQRHKYYSAKTSRGKTFVASVFR